MTATIPKWMKWVIGLMVGIPILIALFPGDSSSETSGTGGPSLFMIWLVVFIALFLWMIPKPKTSTDGKPQPQKTAWFKALAWPAFIGFCIIGLMKTLDDNGGVYGKFPDSGAKHYRAEENSVTLADPVSGRGVRDCPKPVKVPLCHNMSKIRFIPYGEIVDWVSDNDDVDVLYQRIWYALYDSKGDLIEYSNGHMLKKGDHFQLCTTDPRLEGILLPLNCSSRR